MSIGRSLMAGHPVRIGDGFAGQDPFPDIDTAGERGLPLASFHQSIIRQQFDVAVGDVGEGLRGGSGLSRRHVGHAIMDDAFFHVDWIVMRRRAGSFGATALVDGDIYQNTSGAHAPEHVAIDEFGGPGSWQQHRADEKIDRRQ